MKRVQLFEFEDFDWFPSSIRTSMTHLIVVFLKMMGTGDVLVKLIKETKQKVNFNRIVDMGSGSGSAMLMAVQKINKSEDQKIDLLLTDLHPNAKFVNKINNDGDEHTSYQKGSMDATQIQNAPEGLKTMINSFHHMPPYKAKQILQSAAKNKEAILIYELAENKVPLLAWWLFLPISLCLLMIMVLFMTPFVRPMTWQQLVFTYIIPIIPICYAWDGQASLPRTYAFSDIEKMISGLQDGYKWEVRVARKENGKKAGYYVFGMP